jgi:UDP-N-acetylmuramate dehydrogenase
MIYLEHEPLAKYTSWRIGGPARFLANVATPEELRTALAWAAERRLPVALLGAGTNTLARDAGFDGLVVRYRDQEIDLTAKGQRALARIGAGAPMAGTARRLVRQGWAGLEWAEGLPGTVGGAVYGNAGCYGGDIAGSITQAWLLVGDAVEEWPVERFGFGYRTSVLKGSALSLGALSVERFAPPAATLNAQRAAPIVLAAEFALTRADPEMLAEQIERTAATRKSKTPWGSSCGSVFKNPPGDSAGRLIEAAGLKGRRTGGAEIATKHANYIVNLGGASSNDVVALIELAQAEVARQFGVELELEVQIL